MQKKQKPLNESSRTFSIRLYKFDDAKFIGGIGIPESCRHNHN